MKWYELTLDKLIELENGYAFKSDEYAEDGHFLIRIGNVQNGFISSQLPKYVSIPANSNLNQYVLHEGDFLMSLTGNVGRVGFIEKYHLPAALNQRVAKIKIKDTKNIDKRFLFNYFKFEDIRLKIEKLANGAAQLNVSTKDIKSLSISLPPLAEQQRIAALLDTADRILKQRESAIAKMENLIRSYFYEIVLKNSTTDQLFELGSVVELKYGKSLPSQNRRDGEFNVYGSNGVVGSHIESITSGETIIVGRKGSFGEINLSLDCCFPIDTTYYIDKSATKQNIVWLRYALETLKLNTLNKSAAVPGLNREDAYRQKIQLINRNLQNDFEVRIRKIWSLIKTQNDFIHKHKRLIASLQHQSFAVN